ncbi:MAG: zinc ribbon domain-containing protein [Lachnospiraceae bacterium]|nr:zinc ribbon domain-containing protein [Lachnospiraceae bacterium]
MKCKKCGANLDIDHAFCPYCGAKNPVAKKHREDMKRFAKDYADTRKEVIDNTKKFNNKTFLITVISITFVLVAILVLLNVFGEKVKYNIERNRHIKNSAKYVGQVEELIEKEDYLGLADLKKKYGLRGYDTPLEKYNDTMRACEIYSDIFRYTLEALYDKEPSSIADSGSISEYTKMLYRLNDNINEEDSYSKEKISKVIKELNLMFKTFLGLSDETIEGLKDLTDAQRAMVIEEALNSEKADN